MRMETKYLHIEEDGKALAKYLRELDRDDLDPKERDEIKFRAGLRIMRLEKELAVAAVAVDGPGAPA